MRFLEGDFALGLYNPLIHILQNFLKQKLALKGTGLMKLTGVT